MQIVPSPSNERARLNALCQYQILDTAPEAKFDDLTRLAISLCNTPVALISLVDAQRLWFKSKVGLEVNSIPRDIAFCQYAILQTNSLIVPDASVDPLQAFQQIDSTNHPQQAGSGLGLVLSKQLAELHGGRVSFTSTAGSGSTFSVWLPIQR
jgi:light-regulated signal transduction histidine kinase (bacteriophytochrome)